MGIVDEIKNSFKLGSVVTRLIYINLSVFLAVKVLHVLFYLSGQPFVIVEWLAIPANPEALIYKPWTLVTYMFFHLDFFHVIFNVLGLYWFGKMFLSHFEGDKLLSLYILGGLAGGLLYVIAYNVFPVFQGVNGLLLGASASIFAILVALAVYDPNREIHLFFIGKFPLKYVAIFYVLLSVIGISTSNPGGNIAHLGGALWGYFYILQIRKGKDTGAFIVVWINQLAALFKPRPYVKVAHKNPPRDDYEYNRQKSQNQAEINKVLDKISKTGYDSLTKKEKELLFKNGGNNN